MGISLSRKLSADLLSFLSFSLKEGSVPAKVYPMPLHVDMVNLVSRTGRHLQRYDDKGCRQVVGCIPYRFRYTNGAKELEVMMISSQKGSAMMFPKGGWETDESIKDAALRETVEEAGVTGKVEEILGQWTYKSKSQCAYHDGYLFPLLVEEELELWPEKNVRQRRWLNTAEAKKVCKQSWMKEALEVFECRLGELQNGGESSDKKHSISISCTPINSNLSIN